ncbi:hypothetical protein DS893_01895 [Vibrionales bacterium C3R12]|nr:hypothetical protein DS893_01895 [Vibrionales bacterium C3R12]
MNVTKPRLGEIWLLIDSLTFGGIETHVLELAIGLKHFGLHSKSKIPSVRVVLLTEYPEESAIIQKLNVEGIPYSYLHQLVDTENRSTQRFHQLLNQPLHQLHLANRIHQPTLIHAHGYKASILSKLTKLLSWSHPITQFSTFHAGENPVGKVKLYDLCDRYSAGLSNSNLAVSQLIQSKLPVKASVLNNFVNTGNVTRSNGQQLAFVGRLSYEKAPDRILDLAKHFPELVFDIYGSGPLDSDLSANKTSNVKFHGHQNDMSLVWQNIGLLIIPSRFEGLPMAALEAMSRGIPVLAMNVGNLSQLIQHNENGFIANNADQLFEHLQAWLSSSEGEKNAMYQNAINTVNKHYSSEAVIPQFLNVYQILPTKSESSSC